MTSVSHSNTKFKFRTAIAEGIFNQKYSHDGQYTWPQLAHQLATEVCGGLVDDDTVHEIERAILNMEFIPGGRYLYYAGRPLKAYNNCYLLRGEEDTREEWGALLKRASDCLMTGGGIGIDYSVFRPSGAKLGRTGGSASGPIPLMKSVNEVGRNVMQGGSRRSAIYASLAWNHGDADSFLSMKDWHKMGVGTAAGKDGNPYTMWHAKQDDFNFACPLDMTNVSLNYDDDWLFLKEPHKEPTFLKNCEQAMRSGEPGFSFNFGPNRNATLRNACVTADTLILTDRGYVPIVDRIGLPTSVWNGERWSQVTPFSTGVNPIVRVELSDGSYLECTPYHEFLVADGDYHSITEKRVEAADLRVGDRLMKYEMPIQQASWLGVDSEMYSQGFYSADGNSGMTYSWLYEPKWAVAPHLTGTVSSTIYERNGVSRKVWRHGNMLEKNWVPLEDSSPASVMSWFAGLIDGDGTVTKDKNGNGIQLCSVDREFLLKVRLLLTRFGVRAKVVGGSPAGERSMPDGNGGKALYSCQQTWRLLVGNTDTHHLCNVYCLDRICKRLKLDPTARPQRDARRFVTVVGVTDLGYSEETFCFTEPFANRGTFNGIVTGQCCEVVSEDDSDVCNLGSVNMSRIETLERFRDVVRLGSIFLACGTLRADLPFDKVYAVREKNRRLGLGLMGIHEWLLRRGYSYEVTPELHKWLWAYKVYSEEAATEFCNKRGISVPVAFRAIAPTGTIGLIAGTTTGIEPLFAVAYKRRFLRGSTQWMHQYVVDGTAAVLIDETGVDPDKIETAYGMSNDFERRIRFQADVQDYVDMAISSTINLPAWGSEHNNEDKVEGFAKTLARYAHRLRGFTVYPDGSRGGQPLTEVPYAEAVAHGDVVYEDNDSCKGGVCGI